MIARQKAVLKKNQPSVVQRLDGECVVCTASGRGKQHMPTVSGKRKSLMTTTMPHQPSAYCNGKGLDGWKAVRREEKSRSKKELFLLPGLVSGIFFLELLNPSCSINEFLLSGKKRVACGADLHTHFGVDRAEFDFVATGTDCFDFMIFGMGIGFHGQHSC
jgi:hypothetical protein